MGTSKTLIGSRPLRHAPTCRTALALAILAVWVVTLTVSGCSAEKDDAAGHQSRAPVESSADRYQAALARFTQYEKLSEPIFAQGKATPQARALLARYWQTTGPQTVPATYQKVADAKLRQMDSNDIQIKGLPKVLWSKPTQVIDTRVRIEQCVDHRTQRFVQDGKQAPYSDNGAVTRQVELVRVSKGQPWMLTQLDEGDGNKPCSEAQKR